MNEPLNPNKTLLRIIFITTSVVILFLPNFLFAQQNKNDSIPEKVTLQNCIQYALQHNPDIQNAKIDEAITETTIKSKLADWYPQVNLNYNLQHNFQLPTLNFNGNLTHTGTENTSAIQVGATQNIFNLSLIHISEPTRPY